MNLTASSVERLPYTPSGQRFYRDSALKGFGIRVGTKTKTYFVEAKSHGRTVRASIGKHGSISAGEARAQARRLLDLLAKGEHPTRRGATQERVRAPGGASSDSEVAFEETARSRLRSVASPAELEAMALVMNLTRVASRLIRDLDALVHRPLGWTWPGFRIMFAIAIKGPLEQSDIARLTGYSRASVSAAVATLERDGLVSRAPSTADARAVVVSTTGKGERAVMRGFHEQSRKVDRWASCLTGRDQQILVGLLRVLLRRRLRSMPADGEDGGNMVKPLTLPLAQA